MRIVGFDGKPVKLGDKLTAEEKRYLLAAFVNRYTADHIPHWVMGATRESDGYEPPVQFASDSDWLANTEFAVTADGKLDRGVSHCHSMPTWPENPELRKVA